VLLLRRATAYRGGKGGGKSREWGSRETITRKDLLAGAPSIGFEGRVTTKKNQFSSKPVQPSFAGGRFRESQKKNNGRGEKGPIRVGTFLGIRRGGRGDGKRPLLRRTH